MRWMYLMVIQANNRLLWKGETRMAEVKQQTRDFHLGDILSITTGRLVSTRHMDGIYDILDYMTGDSNYTHQLPRAADECRPYLLEAHPFLSEISGDEVTTENYKEWLDQKVAQYGEYHAVRPIHFEDHEVIDPIEELKRMGVDESKIIGIDISETDEPSPYGDIAWKDGSED